MGVSPLVELSGTQNIHKAARIALVNMPFAMTNRPSIQCGLLKSVLVRAGHKVDVHYLNLELAAEVGADNYGAISEWISSLLGEWLFSSAAFGYCPNETAYLMGSTILKEMCEKLGFEWLCRLRKEVLPDLIQRWTTQIEWESYAAVGFTSTFAQNNAAFALARSIKRRFPKVTTIFGGANFDGEMGKEFLRKLSFIDYVVDGEGEEPLLALTSRLAGGESGAGIQGVSGRVGGTITEGGRAMRLENLDWLPDPDYDEYFETLLRLGQENVIGDQASALLVFESARGCWWGEKHHCTFCGLTDMTFRSKTPERVLEELGRLTNRYLTLNVEVIDNIMDMKYVEQVFGRLVHEHCDYRLFWEVKANLTPAQLRTISRAGVVEVQAGIESLNTHVLGLMRKGITMLKNVRFLKWASYFGVIPHWNLLTGFPGETEEDYIQQRHLIPLLRHLSPPDSCERLWLLRFSPYFFDPSFPVENIRPKGIYRYIYPEAEIDLNAVAYFFEYKMGVSIPVEHHQELFSVLQAWKQSWEKKPRPTLVYRRGPGWIEVIDRRDEEPRNYFLYGVEASVYEFCCETDHTVEVIYRDLQSDIWSGELQDVEAAVKKLCDLGIMLGENGHYLSLALPVNRNWFLGGTTASTDVLRQKSEALLPTTK